MIGNANNIAGGWLDANATADAIQRMHPTYARNYGGRADTGFTLTFVLPPLLYIDGWPKMNVFHLPSSGGGTVQIGREDENNPGTYLIYDTIPVGSRAIVYPYANNLEFNGEQWRYDITIQGFGDNKNYFPL